MKFSINGILGTCGDRQVFIGFAPASDLYKVSFPDTLDEVTGSGYQRRFHREHSLEFKRYIHKEGSTTIPLTFNLRPDLKNWQISEFGEHAQLIIFDDSIPVMTQVDCQHRLGYLKDSPIPFAFMTYIGLDIKDEIEIFRVINGKAKGLSGSLLDLTESKLVGQDLKQVKPELFLALVLHEDKRSPWYQKLDLGGNRTTGPMRVASLRTMQKAVKRFLKESRVTTSEIPQNTAETLINFWKAISIVLEDAWNKPRSNMLTKGIGVYCLMSIAGQLYKKAIDNSLSPTIDYFICELSDFIHTIDWSTSGPLKGFGGSSGADAAVSLLNQLRNEQKTSA